MTQAVGEPRNEQLEKDCAAKDQLFLVDVTACVAQLVHQMKSEEQKAHLACGGFH